jgi:formate hydrogenlyase subunit 6/NADH:ubiquinone oxidoreductase subunit I
MSDTETSPKPIPPPRPRAESTLAWVARPMLTAARQFGKSLVRPSTVVYPFERLEDPKFRGLVGVASGKPIGVGEVWDNYRGVHALNIATCISCNLCAFSCPDICIDMVTVPGGDPKHPKKCPQIDYGKCSFCGFCSDACPEGCLTMTTSYELSVRKRPDMIYTPQKMREIFDRKLPMSPIRLERPANEDSILLDAPLCIGCNACARDCPTTCITMVDIPKPAPKPGEKAPRRIWKEPVINDSDCVRCGTCISVCPKECLLWGTHP